VGYCLTFVSPSPLASTAATASTGTGVPTSHNVLIPWGMTPGVPPFVRLPPAITKDLTGGRLPSIAETIDSAGVDPLFFLFSSPHRSRCHHHNRSKKHTLRYVTVNKGSTGLIFPSHSPGRKGEATLGPRRVPPIAWRASLRHLEGSYAMHG
jgi:hypothetical protein